MTIYYLTIIWFLFNGYLWKQKPEYRSKLLYGNFILLLLIYGFRYKVGADWITYINIYQREMEHPFAIDTFEIGFKIINLISYETGIGIFLVVLLSTSLFLGFTLKGLDKAKINPFYFFAIVAPYHLVMSGVNYDRQAIALSIFLYALTFLFNKNKPKFVLWVLIAGTFHMSVWLFLILALADIKKRYVAIISAICVPPIAYIMFQRYGQTYIIQNIYDSKGLILRLGYIVVPSVYILIHLVKNIKNIDLLYFRIGLAIVLSVPILLAASYISTTIADRFSYYFIILSTLYVMNTLKTKSLLGNVTLDRYVLPSMFVTSMSAFIVWSLYSKYIPVYRFHSYFIHWLS